MMATAEVEVFVFLESLSVFKPPRFDLSDLRKHLFHADRTM